MNTDKLLRANILHERIKRIDALIATFKLANNAVDVSSSRGTAALRPKQGEFANSVLTGDLDTVITDTLAKTIQHSVLDDLMQQRNFLQRQFEEL